MQASTVRLQTPATSKRRALAAALACLALAASPEARAQESQKSYPPCTRQPTETDIAGAKGAFQAGQASFDEADYRRAIDYWEDAYRRDCTAHALLLNLARAYELNGNRADAVVALSTYLEREPSTADKDKIERRLEVLRKQLESEQAAAAPQPPAPERAETPVEAPSPPPPAVTAEEPAAEPSGRRSLVPLFVAGGGAVLALAGGGLYLSAQSDLDEAEALCPGRVCPEGRLEEDANAARTRANIGGAMTVGGVLVVGGGLAWYFLSPPSGGSAASTSALVPVAAPNYAGLSYSGRF